MILPPPPPPDRPKMASSSAKMAQDRSKTFPRPPQDDFEALLFASSFPSSIWVRSGPNLGSTSHPLGRPKGPPKSNQKTLKNHIAARRRPRSLLDGPGPPHRTPQDPHRAPQDHPRPPRTPSLGLPRTPPGPLQMPQEAPQREQESYYHIVLCQ